jgi:hypothetical protein
VNQIVKQNEKSILENRQDLSPVYSMWAGKWTISGNCLLYAESSNIERAEAKSPTNFVMILKKILVVVACKLVDHYSHFHKLDFNYTIFTFLFINRVLVTSCRVTRVTYLKKQETSK